MCDHVVEGNCCDSVPNEGPALSITVSNIRPGQCMRSWNFDAQGHSGCVQRVEISQHVHGAHKSRCCSSNNGLTISPAKWHRRQPASELMLDPHS